MLSIDENYLPSFGASVDHYVEIAMDDRKLVCVAAQEVHSFTRLIEAQSSLGKIVRIIMYSIRSSRCRFSVNTDLLSDMFLDSLRSFLYRQDRCNNIYSDQVTTFVGWLNKSHFS